MNINQLKDVPDWAVWPVGISLILWVALPKLFPFWKTWLSHKTKVQTKRVDQATTSIEYSTSRGKLFWFRIICWVGMIVIGQCAFVMLFMMRNDPAPATVGNVSLIATLAAAFVAGNLQRFP
jgi:hypothetical protein